MGLTLGSAVHKILAVPKKEDEMVLVTAFVTTLLALAVLLCIQLVLMFKYGNDPWVPRQYRKVGWIWMAIGTCYVFSTAVGSGLGGLIRWWEIFTLLGIGFLAWSNFRKADKLLEPRERK